MKRIPKVPYKRSAKALQEELGRKDWFQERKKIVEPAVRTIATARIMIGIHYVGFLNQREIKKTCLTAFVLDKCEKSWKDLEKKGKSSFFGLLNKCSRVIAGHLDERYGVPHDELVRIKNTINETNYHKSFDQLWFEVFGGEDNV